MTPFELYAVLLCLVVAASLTLWLRVSRNRGRRRIPERLEVNPEAQKVRERAPRAWAGFPLLLDEDIPIGWIKIQGETGPWAVLPKEPLGVVPVDQGTVDLWEESPMKFDWPTTPSSSRPFDQDNPRPWAHG